MCSYVRDAWLIDIRQVQFKIARRSKMEMEISFPGGARVDAALGNFVIQTDQPPHGGGEGSAPPPFALFLASKSISTVLCNKAR